MKFTIEFTVPRHRWMPLVLRSGDDELILDASCTPFDSLAELASALLGFLESRRRGVAHFHCEPAIYDLVFEPAADSASLRLKVLLHWPGGNGSDVVWLHEGDALQIGRTLWRALRGLESGFQCEHWNSAFPTKLVEALDRATRSPSR